MGGPYVGNAATFLVETLFGLYILVVMLRFVLQWVRAPYNQISQFIDKATQPPLRPLRQFLPDIGRISLACVVLMLVLQFLALWLTSRLLGSSPGPIGLAVFSLAELLRLLVNVFFFAVIIQVVISWVNPGAYNPVTSLLHSLTEPLMLPARRMLPPIQGFDLSPIPVLIALQLAKFLLVDPIQGLARTLM